MYVDGGLADNFPLSVFDSDSSLQARHATVSISLYPLSPFLFGVVSPNSKWGKEMNCSYIAYADCLLQSPLLFLIFNLCNRSFLQLFTTFFYYQYT